MAIIAGVLLAMFLICAGILSLVVYTVRSSWDRNLQALRETASQQAEKAQAWQEKNIEQTRAEWAKQDADRGEGKRFAESFLAALREHRFADAYRETTATFREQFPSEQELEQFTRGHPVLSNSTMLFDEDVAQQGGTRQRFFFNAVEGEMHDMKLVKVGITVMKDGLNWKADELTVSAIVLPGLSKP